MNGVEILLKNLRVLTNKAAAVRDQAESLGIELMLMVEEVETAIARQNADTEEG